MRILILGGTGLIGSALALQLSHHDVHTLSRSRAPNTIYGDFAQLHSVAAWLPLLDRIDVVVNAVGIFNENAAQSFTDLHVNAPIALFAACEQAGVSRVIQVSALGAAPNAATAYWRSKGQADAALCASALNWSIIRPSLIYAENGRSSRVMCSIASLPLLADLQGCGDVQPVHLDDVIALLVRLIETPQTQRQIINVVGPTAMPLSQWWQQLRQAMGMQPAITIKVLPWIQKLASAMAQYLPSSLLSRDSLAMLRAGNCADVQPFAELLGRTPKPALPAHEAAAVRRAAQFGWMLPMLRITLALVWFLTAVVSLWGWPRDESYALLGAVGIPSSLQAVMFYGSVAMDAAFGLACLLNIAWRWQLLLVLFYSVVIAIAMPQFLLHPFGPLLKNLPILALLLMFDQLSNTRQTISNKKSSN